VNRRLWLILIVVLTVGPVSLWAQDKPPIVLGDFETQGSVTAGYRFTSVSGRRQKFRELFNLNEHVRPGR
jgi:hypothetical protein